MTRKIKVYLNTIEDLTKALKDGKTVYYDCDDEEEMEIKLVNGLLVQKYEEVYYVGPGDLKFDTNEFYIKEKEPLKIEVGEFYKTRNGKKVICAYKSKHEKDGRPYFFSSVGGDELFSTWTAENGFCSGNEKEIYKRDIVDYWED